MEEMRIWRSRMVGRRVVGLEDAERVISRRVTPREARAWLDGLVMEEGRVRAMISWRYV